MLIGKGSEPDRARRGKKQKVHFPSAFSRKPGAVDTHGPRIWATVPVFPSFPAFAVESGYFLLFQHLVQIVRRLGTELGGVYVTLGVLIPVKIDLEPFECFVTSLKAAPDLRGLRIVAVPVPSRTHDQSRCGDLVQKRFGLELMD